jgi:hypothetical protein
MLFKVLHGTITEVPAWEDLVDKCIKFDNLSYDHEDAKTKAVYFTDNQSVCRFFSEEKMVDTSTMIQTTVTSDVMSKKPYIMDSNPTDSHLYNEKLYLWPEDRDIFYDALRDEGYDAVIIEAGYSVKGTVSSDIAVLDTSIIIGKTVSYKINGKWTPELNKEDAQKLLSKIANDPEIIQQSFSVEEREVGDHPLYGC